MKIIEGTSDHLSHLSKLSDLLSLRTVNLACIAEQWMSDMAVTGLQSNWETLRLVTLWFRSPVHPMLTELTERYIHPFSDPQRMNIDHRKKSEAKR